MSKIWIKNGQFITLDEQNQVTTGHMVIEGDTIQYIGAESPSPEQSFDEIIDGRHRLYMPGLVNTHNHAAMSLLRGYGDDLQLQAWLENKIWPTEARFTGEDVYWGSSLSIVEMIKTGTTCFVDMYGHMDQVATAVEKSGMRACLTRGVIGFGSEAEQREKLKEARAFAEKWNGQANGRITTMMAPHAPYTCSPEFITLIVDASAQLALPIHIHMSETAAEVAQNVKDYGKRPVAHLRDLGVFDRPCLVAHAVHLNDDEIAILAENDVHVSHNPGSNLKLASGIARLPELLEAGVLVSLGTDSSASNNNLDMLEEIRLAALLHKGQSQDPTVIPAEQAIRMGTIDGAKSIWLEQIGKLQAGMKADVIALDLDQPHFYPRTNYISHVVYAASSGDVTDVWVDGQRLLENRELKTMDEDKVKAEFSACYERLMH